MNAGVSFPDLTEQQALKLLGCASDEFAGLVARGTLPRGVRPGTVDGQSAFRLARALHARACEVAWDRVKHHACGGTDIQGRPLQPVE